MEKIAIVYWSGTGNTEAMANAIADGAKAAGAEVDVYTTDAAAEVLSAYEKLAFGCPSMGDEVLEESEFEPLFSHIEASLSGKKVALFGSYGWGDGAWMRDWSERVAVDGAQLFEEGFTQNYEPDVGVCGDFGSRFAAF